MQDAGCRESEELEADVIEEIEEALLQWAAGWAADSAASADSADGGGA